MLSTRLKPSQHLKLVIAFQNVCGKDTRHVTGGSKFQAIFQLFRFMELNYLVNMRTQRAQGRLPASITESHVVTRQGENGDFTLGIMCEHDADRGLTAWKNDVEEKLDLFATNPGNGFARNIALHVTGDHGTYFTDASDEVPMLTIQVK